MCLEKDEHYETMGACYAKQSTNMRNKCLLLDMGLSVGIKESATEGRVGVKIVAL